MKQSGEKAAKDRFLNYKEQPLQFRFPDSFTGTLAQYGISADRRTRSGASQISGPVVSLCALALDGFSNCPGIKEPGIWLCNLATASLLGPEDIVIAISYSGETRETVLAAKAAKERGAKVIAITQANRNTLSRMADYPLFVPGEEKELRVGAMTSRTSGLLILDLLYLGIAKHDPQRTEENLRQTRDLIRAFQEE